MSRMFFLIFPFQITHLILSSVGLSSLLFSCRLLLLLQLFFFPLCALFGGLPSEGSGIKLFFLAVMDVVACH